MRPVVLTDVTARDGLQALPTVLDTGRKLRLIEDLVAAGCRSIEVASFVNRKLVPTMSDADELCRHLPRHDGIRFGGVVLSAREFERFERAELDWAGVAVSASDTFLARNQRCDRGESLARVAAIEARRRGTPVEVAGYVSCCFACPFEGPTSPDAVAELCDDLLGMGVDTVFLADTNGRGSPPGTRALLDRVLARVPADKLGCHFHDTFGLALANLDVALGYGVSRIDAAVAGLGGCPFVPNAAGNVASEDVLALLDSYGRKTGISAQDLAATGAELCAELGQVNNSKASRALVRVGRATRA